MDFITSSGLLQIMTVAILAWAMSRNGLLGAAPGDEAAGQPGGLSRLSVRLLERTDRPLLVADKPWESFCVNTCTVVREGEQWHMWYESFDSNYESDNDAYYCYARSNDGIRWEKPELSIVKYNGSKDNNILLAGPQIGGMHGASVFLDVKAPTDQRYKMVFVRMLRVPPNMSFGEDNPDWHIERAVSGDGLHWTVFDEPALVRLSDTHHTAFYDGNRYRLYTRLWHTEGQGPDTRRRMIGYTESPTFGDFPQPTEILRADGDDPPDMDFYNSAVAKLRDGLYVMFPSAFYHGSDEVAPHVAASTDGVAFTRLNDRQPILPLGDGFDSGAIYIGPGAIPGPRPDTWWIYYSGNDYTHGQSLPNQIHFGGGIGRALIEVSSVPEPTSSRGAGALGSLVNARRPVP